jgi:hypothetical protein
MSDQRAGDSDVRAEIEHAVALLRESPNYDDDKPTLVTHYLDCDEEGQARELVDAALDLGLELEADVAEPDDEDPTFSVALKHYILIDVETLVTLRETFEITAKSVGAVYDGWEASPQDQIELRS